jgi:hypothetical protein
MHDKRCRLQHVGVHFDGIKVFRAFGADQNLPSLHDGNTHAGGTCPHKSQTHRHTTAMTPTPPLYFPTTSHFVLANASVPAGMVQGLPPDARLDEEGSARIDLVIDEGRIAAIYSAHTAPQGVPQLDLDGRQVWPCFVDMHTHLDKGHVIPRIRPDGTIQGGAALFSLCILSLYLCI